MGTILLYAMVLVIANVVVDIVYAYLDPRIRYT
jgi:ABC-type dipeptide/oligopeptide/nickel transport system permease component